MAGHEHFHARLSNLSVCGRAGKAAIGKAAGDADGPQWLYREAGGEGSRSPSLFFRIEQKNLLSPMEGAGSSCEAKTKIRAPWSDQLDTAFLSSSNFANIFILRKM